MVWAVVSFQVKKWTKIQGFWADNFFLVRSIFVHRSRFSKHPASDCDNDVAIAIAVVVTVSQHRKLSREYLTFQPKMLQKRFFEIIPFIKIYTPFLLNMVCFPIWTTNDTASIFLFSDRLSVALPTTGLPGFLARLASWSAWLLGPPDFLAHT